VGYYFEYLKNDVINIRHDHPPSDIGYSSKGTEKKHSDVEQDLVSFDNYLNSLQSRNKAALNKNKLRFYLRDENDISKMLQIFRPSVDVNFDCDKVVEFCKNTTSSQYFYKVSFLIYLLLH
jgi:hypothetical protein